MPARRQLLQKITLNANAANVTFSNIPQTYTDLVLRMSGRTTDTGVTWTLMHINPNGSNTNGSFRELFGNGSSAGSNAGTRVHGGFCSTAANTANSFGNTEVFIPNYTSGSNKAFFSYGVTETNGSSALIDIAGSSWASTAAITSLTLEPASSVSIVAGSTFYLYGITQVPVIVGGTETISGGYKYHTFTATSSLRVVEAGQVEYLVIAGGGGGGGWTYGGGGGAGGLRRASASVAAGNHTVTVGSGGAGSGSASGSNGTDSSVFSVTSTGGGGGGGIGPLAGAVGGSGGGGGGGGGGAASLSNGGAGTSGQGSNGGGAYQESQRGAGGGGGGAGAVGGQGSQNLGGNGGAGLLLSDWAAATRTGAGGFFAGGGGGATYSDFASTPGTGGAGGGGRGGRTTTDFAVAGTANTGGGAGGTGRDSIPASGGSGIVIIRYPYITN